MTEKKKRLTVALDLETYRSLRQLGLDIDKTNQSMIEAAVKNYILLMSQGLNNG